MLNQRWGGRSQVQKSLGKKNHGLGKICLENTTALEKETAKRKQ